MRSQRRIAQRVNRAIILIHGFAAEKTENGLFLTLATELVRSLGNCAAVLYDWRGLGSSGGSFAHSDLDRHAQDLVTVYSWVRANLLKSDAPCSAIGFSLGAALIAMAHGKGLVLDRAILLSPAIRLDRDMWPRYRDLAELARREHTVSKPGSNVSLGTEILESLNQDLSADLNRLRVPVLACHGTQDERIPIDSTRQLFSNASALWNSVEIEGASHSFRPESPHRQKLYAVVCDWFASAPSASQSSHLRI